MKRCRWCRRRLWPWQPRITVEWAPGDAAYHPECWHARWRQAIRDSAALNVTPSPRVRL